MGLNSFCEAGIWVPGVVHLAASSPAPAIHKIITYKYTTNYQIKRRIMKKPYKMDWIPNGLHLLSRFSTAL